MRGFVLGVLVGAAAGVCGTWVVLEERREPGDLEVLAGVEPLAVPDADEAGDRDHRRKKRRRGSRAAGGDDAPPVLTAADRAMQWRGPSVKPPPKDVDFSEAGGRTLHQVEIDRGIGDRRRELTDCIIEARGRAELSARMTLKFLVDEDGRVTRSRVRAPAYLLDRGLYECADRVARSMRFAATGTPTVVTLPFELSF